MSAGRFLRAALGEDVFEEEKREKLGSRGRLLHPRSLRGVYKAAGAKKTTTATRVAAVQNKQAGQLYFVNLVCSAAAYVGEVRFKPTDLPSDLLQSKACANSGFSFKGEQGFFSMSLPSSPNC